MWSRRATYEVPIRWRQQYQKRNDENDEKRKKIPRKKMVWSMKKWKKKNEGRTSEIKAANKKYMNIELKRKNEANAERENTSTWVWLFTKTP